MASHRFLPHDLSSAMITFALLRANERHRNLSTIMDRCANI
jgi:hypothetical protein